VFKHKIINDPVYDGFLSLDDPVILSVLEHPYFQRQRRIKQLGLTCLVYPGAMHTRFSHMLGALNLMERALDVLRQKGVDISDDECQGAKLAILLHDIGHGPFSHTSEHVIVRAHHEDLTDLFMQRMNTNGQLDLAIDIFRNTYHKHFLHQLVSSQLDMDRLDYLGRDSFFTGVSEGIVGTHRIISMLNVNDDQLVVDQKGIYSIEKFIISRRLMYWQVYMHKTVIAADQLLLAILRRARQLPPSDVASPLSFFLHNDISLSDFNANPDLLDSFAAIDDDDVMVAIKQWKHSDDPLLASLSSALLSRRLPAIRFLPSQQEADALVCRLKPLFDSLTPLPEGSPHLLTSGILRNRSYDFADNEIKILFKDGSCLPISQASDQLDHHFLEKTVVKHFVCFPKQCFR